MESYPIAHENPEDSPEMLEKRQTKKQARRFERRTLPEQEAERLGQVIVAAERKSGRKQEQREHKSTRKTDLLARSANIYVAGTNLREVFEERRISEAALERLVVAHEQGQDIEPILSREILEHEKDYERDPQLRGGKSSAVRQSGSAAKLEELLQKLEPTSTSGKAARHMAEARHELGKLDRRARRSHWADITLGATIVILVALILILLLTR